MQPEHHKNIHAAELGSLGGLRRKERLTAQERSAIARHAARARHHPRQFRQEQERAQEIAYLVTRALKDKQLPLI